MYDQTEYQRNLQVLDAQSPEGEQISTFNNCSFDKKIHTLKQEV